MDVTESRPPADARMGSLDALKGVLLLAIFMLGNPGRWDYAVTKQVEWNGCAFPDGYVFPGFMFAAGIAMALSFARAAGRVSRWVLLRKTAQRAFWLILVGAALVWFPWWQQPFSQLVFANVLTRIALAMPVPVPVPGIGAGVLEPGQDVGAWLDRVLWLSDPEHPNDESLFGTYPAIVSVLLGAFTGHWIQRTPDRKRLVRDLVLAGAACVLVSLAWDVVYPINKARWTSSFVLWTGGWLAAFLGLLVYVIDVRGWRRWAFPLYVLGANTLFGFVIGNALIALTRSVIMVSPGVPLGLWSIDHIAAWMPWPWAPLFYGLCQTLIFFAILYVLYRKKIFIKL